MFFILRKVYPWAEVLESNCNLLTNFTPLGCKTPTSYSCVEGNLCTPTHTRMHTHNTWLYIIIYNLQVFSALQLKGFNFSVSRLHTEKGKTYEKKVCLKQCNQPSLCHLRAYRDYPSIVCMFMCLSAHHTFICWPVP